jgi:hypothetical protein
VTDGDRISIISYVRERLDSQDATLTEIKELCGGLVDRMEAIEAKNDKRDGRDRFIVNGFKTLGALIVTACAAIGGYFSIKPH